MPLTLEELKEKLAEQIDEITLLDILGITSYDLVQRFEDVIEDKFEKLEKEVDD
jgi:hypothetical protein